MWCYSAMPTTLICSFLVINGGLEICRTSEIQSSPTCYGRLITSITYRQYREVVTVRFLLFVLSMSIGLAVLVVNWILITDFAIHRGISLTHAVLITSIGCIVDTIFRVFAGMLFDISVFRSCRVLIFNIIFLVNGLVMITMAFTYSYYSMLTLSVIQYVCSAVMMGQRQVIICDLFGVETLATTLPFTLMVQGLGLMLIPGLLGLYWYFFLMNNMHLYIYYKYIYLCFRLYIWCHKVLCGSVYHFRCVRYYISNVILCDKMFNTLLLSELCEGTRKWIGGSPESRTIIIININLQSSIKFSWQL